jgi:signal transduction histidine kinase
LEKVDRRVQGRSQRRRIEDNDISIPPEQIDRVFDSFFTTKEEVGTGIGLWVTKEFVGENGGSISLSGGSLENGNLKCAFR